MPDNPFDSGKEFPKHSIPIPACDPRKFQFRTGEFTGGEVDGKPFLAFTVLPIDNPILPDGSPNLSPGSITLILSKDSCVKLGHAILTYLSLSNDLTTLNDEDDLPTANEVDEEP